RAGPRLSGARRGWSECGSCDGSECIGGGDPEATRFLAVAIEICIADFVGVDVARIRFESDKVAVEEIIDRSVKGEAFGGLIGASEVKKRIRFIISIGGFGVAAGGVGAAETFAAVG